jgi:hypothetical protein
MIGCALWWGELSFDFIQSGETTVFKFQPAWAPPFLFQSNLVSADDDDDDFSGDDDNYLQGERIRGVENKHKKKSDSSTSTSTKQEDPFADIYKSRPKMVWLMSFPNSGTSYTMTMVSRASNRSIATNYGREVTVPPTLNTPLYPDQDWSYQGPYYNPNPRRPLPDDYILVKTHCGGKCIDPAISTRQGKSKFLDTALTWMLFFFDTRRPLCRLWTRRIRHR